MFGSRAMATCCRNRRRTLKSNRITHNFWKDWAGLAACTVICFILTAHPAFGQAPTGPVRITLDEAIQMALQHNHNMIAARTAIDQSLAQEVTANFRPNPTLVGDWEYLPFFSPSNLTGNYLSTQTRNRCRRQLPHRARPQTPGPLSGGERRDGPDALAGRG